MVRRPNGRSGEGWPRREPHGLDGAGAPGETSPEEAARLDAEEEARADLLEHPEVRAAIDAALDRYEHVLFTEGDSRAFLAGVVAHTLLQLEAGQRLLAGVRRKRARQAKAPRKRRG